MKVACLQFNPQVGDFQGNVVKANTLLRDAEERGELQNLSWLLLPEMALTGYNFPNLAAITPFLEPTTAGPSTNWAREVAMRLKSHVTIGYPEIEPATSRRYNSTVTVSPTGEVLVNYRKSFLYYTDETWASEGPERFFRGQVNGLGEVAMGICMDINPHKFLAPWTAFEFANHCLQPTPVPLVAINMAWLTRLGPEEVAADPKGVDAETLAYWLERFYPLLKANADMPLTVIFANRCGTEGGVVYAGTSTVMRIEKGGSTKIFDILGQGEERLLLVDLKEPPKFAVTTGPPGQAPGQP
ncbi:carbon-nitrogen hydrolase [Phyllosticta capitalensis]|uniref:Carbon-nitrogen hydrolase n=1 Tax=Phyllosticta capitalensis TaxID=121624 RepID=A0ABR1Z3F1_9PEZI